MDRSFRFRMPRLDDQRGRYSESRRKSGNVYLHLAIELVGALNADRKTLAAAGVDGRVSTIERDFKIGLRLPHDQPINKTLAVEPARIGHSNQVSALRGGGEMHA